jgi:hypothetical protein
MSKVGSSACWRWLPCVVPLAIGRAHLHQPDPVCLAADAAQPEPSAPMLRTTIMRPAPFSQPPTPATWRSSSSCWREARTTLHAHLPASAAGRVRPPFTTSHRRQCRTATCERDGCTGRCPVSFCSQSASWQPSHSQGVCSLSTASVSVTVGVQQRPPGISVWHSWNTELSPGIKCSVTSAVMTT